MDSQAELLAANLKTLRKANGYTQGQVAEYLGIDQTTISKIESGARTIGMAALEKLAALYFCSVERFFETSPSVPKVAYRRSGMSEQELEDMAAIGRIVANLEEMAALRSSNGQ